MRLPSLPQYGLLALVCVLVVPCLAQVQTAQVSGRITDPSGSVVPDAGVSIVNVSTGVVLQAKSNETGYFYISYLPPGNYEISVAKAGFRPLTRTGLHLEVQQVARLDFVLEIGAVTQKVEVSGEAPLVESETSSVGHVITNKSIVEIPLNGRNLWDLVLLTPGLVYQRAMGDAGEQPVYSVAGRSGGQYYVDGGLLSGQPILAPMVDTVDEFKIVTTNYSAEYSGAAGAVVTSALKSGTNEFHGDLFEFLRNDKLRAWDFFANRALPKAPLHYNQFGGTLGGPSARTKLSSSSHTSRRNRRARAA